MAYVPYESKLRSVHPWIHAQETVWQSYIRVHACMHHVYHALAAHAISADIKCLHCRDCIGTTLL